MRNTVAIIGSHPATRSLFDFERKDCDVWIFNGAFNDATGWAKRADAVFQLHLPRNWRSDHSRNGENHYGWLKSGDTPTIYMQDIYDDVPRSVKYPLDEIQTKLLGGFNRKKYFTSSVAFALALAIFQGYKRIELYGVEMETDTEYKHQRDCVAFWVGVAVGHGAEVYSPVGIFSAERLYGYEGETNLGEGAYQERIEKAKPTLPQIEDNYRKARSEVRDMVYGWDGDVTAGAKIVNAVIALSELSKRLGYVEGVVQTAQNFLAQIAEMKKASGEYVINRQDYETQYYQHRKVLSHVNNNAVGVAAQMETKLESASAAKTKKERKRIVEAFLLQVDEFSRYCNIIGLHQAGEAENKNYMSLLDEMTAAAGAA